MYVQMIILRHKSLCFMTTLTTLIKTWVTETFMHKEVNKYHMSCSDISLFSQIPLVAEKVVIPATDISALEEKKGI